LKKKQRILTIHAESRPHAVECWYKPDYSDILKLSAKARPILKD